MKLDIPPFPYLIIQRLKDRGFKALIVGGAIRDRIMGRVISDWDIATSAEPDEIKTLFKDIKSFHLKHGTVTLVHKGREYEVTAFRGKDIYEDLSHRDFTMNAMAYDEEEGNIIDPYGGRQDIRDRVIRGVEDPIERFREDPLRMLRAFRFMAELGFKIDPLTFNSISSLSHLIKDVAGERIGDEFKRLILSKWAGDSLIKMKENGLLFHIIPEIRSLNHLDKIIKKIDLIKRDLILRLCWLIMHVQDGEVIKRLYLSRRLQREITDLLRGVRGILSIEGLRDDKELRRLIYKFGKDNARRILFLKGMELELLGRQKEREILYQIERRTDELIKDNKILEKGELKITGRDIMDIMEIEEGPMVGEIIDRVIEKVLEDPSLNKRDRLIALVEDLRTIYDA